MFARCSQDGVHYPAAVGGGVYLFDNLVLLKREGEAVFVGDLGEKFRMLWSTSSRSLTWLLFQRTTTR